MDMDNWRMRLLDPNSDTHLMVTVVAEFEFEGSRYLAVVPEDELVELIRVVGEDEAYEELDLDEFKAVAEPLNAELSKYGFTVELRSEELVVNGEVDEALYEEGELLGVETEDGEPRDLLVLTSVKINGDLILVAVDANVSFFPAKPQGEDAVPLTDEELEATQEAFEEVAAALDEASGTVLSGEMN